MVKQILKLSSMVMALIPPTAAFAPLVAGAAAVIPTGGDDTEVDAWRRTMIQQWLALVGRLNSIPMANKQRRKTLRGRLRADYFMRFAEMPKDRDLDKLHSDLVFVWKALAASSSTPS